MLFVDAYDYADRYVYGDGVDADVDADAEADAGFDADAEADADSDADADAMRSHKKPQTARVFLSTKSC